MINGNLMNNTKTRRKDSMLQDSLSKIKYLLFLAVLLVLPMEAMAGFPLIIDNTDTGGNRLVAFFDTRGRDTFIQVTNTSNSKINIHVQIFDVNSQFQTECEECNFNDMLTAGDTHVYDMENLVTNMGPIPPLNPSIPVCQGLGADTYGFMIISLTVGPDGSLIGMFRIIDELGYEYRTNAVNTEIPPAFFIGDNNIINFSTANGNNLSDLVGITYVALNGSVYASGGVSTTFGDAFNSNIIYDSDEFPTSCSPTTFACKVGFLDKGIDNSLPNSKGQTNRVCSTSTLDANTSGWLHLPLSTFGCADPLVCNADGTFDFPAEPWFVGFVGLNNGDGTGSMDSWWARF